MQRDLLPNILACMSGLWTSKTRRASPFTIAKATLRAHLQTILDSLRVNDRPPYRFVRTFFHIQKLAIDNEHPFRVYSNGKLFKGIGMGDCLSEDINTFGMDDKPVTPEEYFGTYGASGK